MFVGSKVMQRDIKKRGEKSVLLSYLDRNAVIKVPQLLQKETDITIFEGEVRRRFSFGSNVHVNIIFQKYDQDWKEYITLDSDVVLGDK